MFLAAVIITNSPAANKLTAATDGLRDIKPPVGIPNPWFWILLILGVLAVVAAIVLLVFFLLRKRRLIPPPPIVPPHIRAKQKLQEALSLIGNPLPFCVLVSDTIRGYLEEQFSFHAPERTTEEFLHELQSTDLLNTDQKSSLGNFLESCDLVKFAKYEPRESELRELHSAAIRLVEETEPKPIETTSAESPIADSQPTLK